MSNTEEWPQKAHTPYPKTLVPFPPATQTALNPKISKNPCHLSTCYSDCLEPKIPKFRAIFLPEIQKLLKFRDRWTSLPKPCGDPEMHQTNRHAALPILVELPGRKLQTSMVKKLPWTQKSLKTQPSFYLHFRLSYTQNSKNSWNAETERLSTKTRQALSIIFLPHLWWPRNAPDSLPIPVKLRGRKLRRKFYGQGIRERQATYWSDYIPNP